MKQDVALNIYVKSVDLNRPIYMLRKIGVFITG